MREFHFEVAIMNMLCHHPNIVSFTGYTDKRSYSIIMKLSSFSLHNLIFDKPGKIIDPETLLSLSIDICKGMNFIHQHEIVHLDLKPGNILVDRENGPERMTAKITDFGFATPIDGLNQDDRAVRGLERSKVVGMTDAYAAPEVPLIYSYQVNSFFHTRYV